MNYFNAHGVGFGPFWVDFNPNEAERMPHRYDLGSPGVRDLIRLTNQQFGFWTQALEKRSPDPIPAGHTLNFWFVMSALANEPDFAMKKSVSYEQIPNLGRERTKKYISQLGKHGFIETVRRRGETWVRLTLEGQEAVLSTMQEWINEFGKIQANHFNGGLGGEQDAS